MPTATHKVKKPAPPAKPVADNGNRKPRPTAKSKPEKHSAFGLRLIEGLDEILQVLETEGMAGVKKKFTFHQLKKPTFEKPALGKADVVAIRTALGASQTVFAGLLGVSAATVRAWEQGVNTPSGMATRFLTEIRTDPDYWKARLKEAAGS